MFRPDNPVSALPKTKEYVNMKSVNRKRIVFAFLSVILPAISSSAALADVGVGVAPVDGAEVLFDGTRKMLDDKWTYWEGPRFASSLPIKWKMVDDPVDEGQVVQSVDPKAAGGRYGSADIVTKRSFWGHP